MTTTAAAAAAPAVLVIPGFPALDGLAGKSTRALEKLVQDFAVAHEFSYHVRHQKKPPSFVRFTCAACSNVRDPAAAGSKRRKVEPAGDSNDSQSSAAAAGAASSLLPRIHSVRIGYKMLTGGGGAALIDECWVESAHWTHRCGLEMATVQQQPAEPVEPTAATAVATTHVQLLVNLMHSRLDYAILSLNKNGIVAANKLSQPSAMPYEHLITFQVQRQQTNFFDHDSKLVNAALARLAEMPSTGRVVTDVAVVTSVEEHVYSIEKNEETEVVFLKFFIKFAKS